MNSKLYAGILIGLLIALAAITAVAAVDAPPSHDRVCMCNRIGSCMWIVEPAAANGLTEYPDYYCTGGVATATPIPIVTNEPKVETPEPDGYSVDTVGSIMGAGGAYDVCSIDECSARETISAGVATIAASVSGGE